MMYINEKYLEVTDIIDYHHPEVNVLATKLSSGCPNDEAIAKNCFEYVRDHIKHSGDYKAEITTAKASDVLKHKTGWCYAKSHLLAALLRANEIPAGFAYQRLSCLEYEEGIYCLHGLNSIYLKEHGWYRVDARGNKEGVDAQFTPPIETLAFEPSGDEYDLPDRYAEPIAEVLEALANNSCYSEMVKNFPDIRSKI